MKFPVVAVNFARAFVGLWVWAQICSMEARLIQGPNTNLTQALDFLNVYDKEASDVCFRVSIAQWNYATNMTDFNKRRMIDEQTHKAKFDKLSWKVAVNFTWPQFPNPATRQLKLLVTSGRMSLLDDKYNEIYHLISEMKDIYSNARICPYNNFDSSYCDLKLENDIKRLMAHSRNPDELLHIWKEWHEKVGPPMKNKFMRYVQLANQASRMIGFMDAGEQTLYVYEDDDFEYEIAATFQKLLPLYKELFTYVRKKLELKYGSQLIRPGGPIPAHLLGNIWTQDWSNVYDIVAPYPFVKYLDVTDEMLRLGYTPLRIFQAAEEFYTSLGLRPMPPEFWRFSMMERPKDRQVQCTASAWDFCNGIDYRIKQCTEVDLENLLTTHHEMAHIQYYLQYSDQPYLYRDGANPGFHQGIADAILLSINNPTHLHKMGLLNNSTHTYESNINFLLKLALKKVAYAPYAYIVDQWRSLVFREGVQNMNSAWWELRLRFQGVSAPVPRSEHFLDAAAKKHIPYDIPYIKYYVALLLEYQIYEALCRASGHVAQLHTCDFYRSREAGRILEEAMRVGRARHWKDVIRMVTKGKNDRLSVDAMVEYFQPLMLWLKIQNRDESVIGWNVNEKDAFLFQAQLNNCPNIWCNLKLLLIFEMFIVCKLNF